MQARDAGAHEETANKRPDAVPSAVAHYEERDEGREERREERVTNASGAVGQSYWIGTGKRKASMPVWCMDQMPMAARPLPPARASARAREQR